MSEVQQILPGTGRGTAEGGGGVGGLDPSVRLRLPPPRSGEVCR